MAVTKKKPSAGPRPSAGSMILSSLGMTDLELAAFLPKNAPPQVRGVFWCDFETKLSLPEIASALKKVKGISSVAESEDVELPPDAPPDGITVATVIGSVKGRYVALTRRGNRTELSASFREMGTAWGSNQAVYECLEQRVLPVLGAERVNEKTE